MRVNALIAGMVCAAGLWAQEAPSFPRAAYFRERFTSPSTRVELQAPVRFDDFRVNGSLELSLRSYLELVLANNTDIAIQRLALETPRNAILRAFGTFDPVFTSSFNATRQKTASTSVIQGANLLNSLSQRLNTGYQQTLDSGTQFSVNMNGTKDSSNDAFRTFNPALGATMQFGFTQPLLRNRGSSITRLPIMVARSQLRRSEYDLRDQLIRLITVAETAYWDVVEARENLKVQQEYLKLTDIALKRAQRELELGALSPLEIYRPQQQYANAEIAVSRFEYQLTQREDALRRQMGADLIPEVRRLPIVLTETVSPVLDSRPFDKEGLVERALATRPDMRAQLQTLDVDELQIKQATNNMRPDLALTANYSAQGRGGTFYDRQNVFGQSQLVRVVPGGLSDAMDQLFGFTLPTYSFGLTLRLPLRDRSRSADLADVLVRKKTDSLRARNLEQTVRLDVLNAINQVEAAKKGVELARVAVDFAQKQVEAEQKRYDLGVTIMYFVLLAQSDLANAQSDLLRNIISYRRNVLTLLRVTGQLLDERGVIVNGVK